MILKNKLTTVLAGVAFAMAGPLLAHHSITNYDREHPVTLTGTVVAFNFINPHVTIVFEVEQEDGTVVPWAAGTAPPQRLYRAGWNTKTLKPGDRITITGAPHKEGIKEMAVIKVVGPKGDVLPGGAD